MSIRLFIQLVLSLPKSLFFNFMSLPIEQAIKLPILISYRVRVKCERGKKITLGDDHLYCGMVKLGFGDGSFEKGRYAHSMLYLQRDSNLVFQGKCSISNSFTINNGGMLVFGKNFASNYGLFISCMSSVEFGNDCLLGWNNTFIDNDGHKVISQTGERNISKIIKIGNHNWITSETIFLKGTALGENNVIGYDAFVKTDYSSESNCLIAGNPAKVLKSIKGWEK